jgi:hypothetical protein
MFLLILEVMTELIRKTFSIYTEKTGYTCPVCNEDLVMSKKKAEKHISVPINKTMIPEGFCFLTEQWWCGYKILTHLNIVREIPSDEIGEQADGYYHRGTIAPDHSIIQDSKVLFLGFRSIHGEVEEGMKDENQGGMGPDLSLYEILNETAPARLRDLESVQHIPEDQLQLYKKEFRRKKRNGIIFYDYINPNKWTSGREYLHNILQNG